RGRREGPWTWRRRGDHRPGTGSPRRAPAGRSASQRRRVTDSSGLAAVGAAGLTGVVGLRGMESASAWASFGVVAEVRSAAFRAWATSPASAEPTVSETVEESESLAAEAG